MTEEDLVFAAPETGLPPMPDSLTHAFTFYAKKAGLVGVTLHGLRHSHASIMLKEGVSLKVIQERLGHSGISGTADIYSHVSPDLHRDAVERFGEALERSRTE